MKNRQEYRPECGKTAYGSRSRAYEVARRRGREGHDELRVYNCPRCGYWHLTSSEDRHKAYPVEP